MIESWTHYAIPSFAYGKRNTGVNQVVKKLSTNSIDI